MTIGHYILNDQGEPVVCDDLQAWARWLETSTRDRSRVVAQDVDEGDPVQVVKISTVFIGGIAHPDVGHPLLWETMIFGGVLDGEMERYASRADAIIGHQRYCDRVNATMHRPTMSEAVDA